ncbi:MAG: amidohydrolase family protein, partial [Novosphingobium sp.]
MALAITLSPAPALADILVDNIDGLTIDATGGVERFTGLLVGDDGRIVQVLKRGDERPGKVDYLVDGKGQVLVPGMIDSHGHVISLGFGALTLDLSATRSLSEALAKIGAYAEANPDRPWIMGRGWNQELWPERRFPTAAELDAVVGDRPVWLERVDGHAGWANSRALAAAGVTALTKAPTGGSIERLPGGKPAGVLVD